MFLNEYSYEQRISSFLAGVYGWMCCALVVTAGAAYYVASQEWLFAAIQQPGVLIGLFIVQIGLVIGLSYFLNRLSFASALIMFLLYSASLGVTLSSIFYIYTQMSIMITFLVTAGMFGVMSLYGYMTRSDLTTVGSISFMALIGLIIGMLVNMFLRSSSFDYILSGIGVIIFVLLIAYDTQKLKQFARPLIIDQESMAKITIIGSLMLYLDFINLFLFLLRFLGQKREE